MCNKWTLSNKHNKYCISGCDPSLLASLIFLFTQPSFWFLCVPKWWFFPWCCFMINFADCFGCLHWKWFFVPLYILSCFDHCLVLTLIRIVLVFTFMIGRRERAVGLLPPILILMCCISCISYLYFCRPFLFLFLLLVFLVFLICISAAYSYFHFYFLYFLYFLFVFLPPILALISTSCISCISYLNFHRPFWFFISTSYISHFYICYPFSCFFVPPLQSLYVDVDYSLLPFYAGFAGTFVSQSVWDRMPQSAQTATSDLVTGYRTACRCGSNFDK